MSGSEVRPVNAAELQTAINLAPAMQAKAQQTVTSGQFTFFAAFDGTNNDRTNVPLSDNPLSTNVAQLANQLKGSA
jgi:hypothetical protein